MAFRLLWGYLLSRRSWDVPHLGCIKPVCLCPKTVGIAWSFDVYGDIVRGLCGSILIGRLVYTPSAPDCLKDPERYFSHVRAPLTHLNVLKTAAAANWFSPSQGGRYLI